MNSDPGLDVRTAKCPICHGEIEIPVHSVDADGNYSIQCMKCKVPISGKVRADHGTL
jgi:hypothetical protein